MARKRPVIKLQYDSPVILTFVILCLFALALNSFTDGWANPRFFCVYRSSLSDWATYVRFFGHVIGHSSVSHCIGNLCLLLVLGPIVESRYGSKNLLISILITALVSGLVYFIFFPGYALLGASGVVFMLIFLASISGIRSGNIPISLILVAVLYLGQEIHGMIFAPSDNVSQLTHIIGGVCGIICGSFMAKKRR